MADRPKNLLYAQSGGVSAVINATACGVIATARKHKGKISRVYAGKNGILGVLREELFDTHEESDASIKQLLHTPGGAFGSCRYKLRDIDSDSAKYQRILDVCEAHNIGYFLYNGGNDSADTSNKIAKLAAERGVDLICVGVPKTIDNDLALTDFCPGFASAAKYTAVSIREAALDVAAMAETSTKVFILEVMGRHAGWLAASAGLSAKSENEAPHIILFPERRFEPELFLARVQQVVARVGYCVVVASEGLKTSDGRFLAESGGKDAFGHTQLGGVAQELAQLLRARLGLKFHFAIPDYLQRSARHLASAVDVDVAFKVGEAAVQYALARKNAVMPIIKRLSSYPYRYEIKAAALAQIANTERFMPEEFIREDGFGITAAARRYLEPLIVGEAYPPYKKGLPEYVTLKNRLLSKKLPEFS